MLQMYRRSKLLMSQLPDNSNLKPTAFTSKNLSCTEMNYGNKEIKAMRILHGLEKCHYY